MSQDNPVTWGRKERRKFRCVTKGGIKYLEVVPDNYVWKKHTDNKAIWVPWQPPKEKDL